MGDQEQNLIVQPPPGRLTIDLKPRHLEMYQVSGAELTRLASGTSSLHSGFFGTAFGAAITLMVTLLTVPLTDRLLATFVALFVVSVIFAIYFGIRTRRDSNASQREIQQIIGTR